MELSAWLLTLYKQLFGKDNELFAKEEEEKQAFQSQSGWGARIMDDEQAFEDHKIDFLEFVNNTC